MRTENLVHALGFGEEFCEIDVNWSGEGEIETDGYIVFAICAYHRDRERELDTYEYDFALETSGVRRPGIYRAVSAMHALDQPIQLSWHAEDFCDWLGELIEKKGIYERPALP